LKLVSIIIPCYNYAHLINETLDSILLQTYANWEVLVVNDGSTDNTLEVVSHYQKNDDRIRYISITNSGPSRARNVGIEASKGEFLMFIDADDLMPPPKLESHIKHFEKFPELDISYSDGLYFDERYPEILYRRGSLRNQVWIPKLINKKGFQVIYELLRRNIMPICSPLFRKRVINNVGLLDEDYYYMEDWDYFVRSAFAGYVFGYLDGLENAVLIRVQKKSLSKNAKRMALHEAALRKKFDLLLNNTNDTIALSSTDIKVLKQVNNLEINRALVRGGEFRGVAGIFTEKSGLGVLGMTRIVLADTIRYARYIIFRFFK
jgi:glycosyltransferase involved in cell wall biosynthesis